MHERGGALLAEERGMTTVHIDVARTQGAKGQGYAGR